jgi:hypothetical protein
MTRILKFPLIAVEAQVIDMPEGASPLSVIPQYDRPTLYVSAPVPAADAAIHMVPRTVFVIATGEDHPLPYDWFVGTVAVQSGTRVWHVFVRPEAT